MLTELVNPEFADYVYYSDSIESIEPPYLQKYFDMELAYIINQA